MKSINIEYIMVIKNMKNPIQIYGNNDMKKLYFIILVTLKMSYENNGSKINLF